MFFAACSGPDPTSPSFTYTGSLSAENFAGTLVLGGTGFYSFTVPREGPISMTLLDLQEDGASSAAAISLGLGVPVGTGCSASTASTVPAGSTPQIIGTYSAGVYCARVEDVGNLSVPARFTVHIVRPQ